MKCRKFSDEEIERYALEPNPAEEFGLIEEHQLVCDDCQRSVKG